MTYDPELVKSVADAVMYELTGRKGIRQAFDLIDDDILEEIRAAVSNAALHAADTSATHWLAPAKATAKMQSAASRRCGIMETTVGIVFDTMRDAYLAERGDATSPR